MASVWRYMAGRAAGSSHCRSGAPCQDAFACEPLDGGIVAVVADGAGSAANSERGAAIAVQTTAAEVAARIASGRADFPALLTEAVLCAREAVIADALAQAADPRTYASTLLALVITEQGGAACQIGDGVIVVAAEGAWTYITWPQHGEYANTTYFLTADDALDHLVVVALEPTVTAFGLTTDGLERLVLHFDTLTVHAPFFDGMLRPLLAAETPEAVERLSPSLAAFLASERVAARTDDDVTLVMAVLTAVPE